MGVRAEVLSLMSWVTGRAWHAPPPPAARDPRQPSEGTARCCKAEGGESGSRGPAAQAGQPLLSVPAPECPQPGCGGDTQLQPTREE